MTTNSTNGNKDKAPKFTWGGIITLAMIGLYYYVMVVMGVGKMITLYLFPK